MKLTTAQRSLLSRELHDDKFICLLTASDDRVAKKLAEHGLGYFTNFSHHYSWRPRSGYINHFTPNSKGLAAIYEVRGA